MASDAVTAARLYAEAARSAATLPERDHLTRQAVRLNTSVPKNDPSRRQEKSFT
jgi:hypothetical protein